MWIQSVLRMVYFFCFPPIRCIVLAEVDAPGCKAQVELTKAGYLNAGKEAPVENTKNEHSAEEAAASSYCIVMSSLQNTAAIVLGNLSFIVFRGMVIGVQTLCYMIYILLRRVCPRPRVERILLHSVLDGIAATCQFSARMYTLSEFAIGKISTSVLIFRCI